jgi:hypothetical protein
MNADNAPGGGGRKMFSEEEGGVPCQLRSSLSGATWHPVHASPPAYNVNTDVHKEKTVFHL